MTENIHRPDSPSHHDSDEVSDRSGDVNRREFMARSAMLGVAAGAAGLGLHSGAALADGGSGKLKLAGGRSIKPIEIDSKMARWKKPQSLEFVSEATKRFNFPNWQSGNDDSVYYNLNIPSFFPTRVVAQPGEFSVLERNLQPELLNLAFADHLGKTTPRPQGIPCGTPAGTGDDDGAQGQGGIRDLSGHESPGYPCVDVRIQDDRGLARLHARG